jgi:hypothetical protein
MSGLRIVLQRLVRFRRARKLWSLIGDVSTDGGAEEANQMRHALERWAYKHGVDGYASLDDGPTCSRCDCSVSVRDGEEWEQGTDVCDHCAQDQARTSNAAPHLRDSRAADGA